MTKLEFTVLDIIQHGRDRCGAGFGRYPLGVRAVVEKLLPLVDLEKPQPSGGRSIREALNDFDARLAR